MKQGRVGWRRQGTTEITTMSIATLALWPATRSNISYSNSPTLQGIASASHPSLWEMTHHTISSLETHTQFMISTTLRNPVTKTYIYPSIF